MTGAHAVRTLRIFTRRAPGGFNLLPWRPRAIQRLRRQRALEWLAAALAGGACALGVLLWQAVERHTLDAQRTSLEQSLAQSRTPLAEAARLVREAETRRTALQLAQQHARTATHFLALTEALARDALPGVGLQQLTQTAYETDLQASAADETAVAAWLGRLRAMPEVEAVSVRELKRGTLAGGARLPLPALSASPALSAFADPEPIRVAAHLVWKGASAEALSDAPRASRTKPKRAAAAKEAK